MAKTRQRNLNQDANPAGRVMKFNFLEGHEYAHLEQYAPRIVASIAVVPLVIPLLISLVLWSLRPDWVYHACLGVLSISVLCRFWYYFATCYKPWMVLMWWSAVSITPVAVGFIGHVRTYKEDFMHPVFTDLEVVDLVANVVFYLRFLWIYSKKSLPFAKGRYNKWRLFVISVFCRLIVVGLWGGAEYNKRYVKRWVGQILKTPDFTWWY